MSSAARLEAKATSRGLFTVAILVAAASVVAGCGDDDDEVTPPPAQQDTGPAAILDAAPDAVLTEDVAVTDTGGPGEDAVVDGGPVAELTAIPVAAAPTGPDDAIWAGAPARAVVSENMSTGLAYGEGELNMTGTKTGTASFNKGVSADLMLKAAYTSDTLYILAEWKDATLDIDRRRQVFDGAADPTKPSESPAGWSAQLNDDKIGFAFEIAPAQSEFGKFQDVGCRASCHVAPTVGLDMRPSSGKVDIWHWKTSRTEVVGFVNDQYSSPEGRKNDNAGIEKRNTDGARMPPKFIWNGTPQEFTRWDGMRVTLDPAYVLLDAFKTAFTGNAATGKTLYGSKGCTGCHGATGSGGFAPALVTNAIARKPNSALDAKLTGAGGHLAVADATERANIIAYVRGLRGVPGYYIVPPTGDDADLPTISNVKVDAIGADTTMLGEIPTHTTYRVMIVRKLDTKSANDVVFDPSKTYVFGVALMDNDGKNHVGSAKETLRFQR